YHVNIMQAVLKELTLALDHLFLFQKTLQAEEEWKTTFNQVSIGLAVVDEKCFIKRANKAFWELFLPDDPMPAQPVHWDVLLQSNS
ncbi:MAG: hypothetical protein GWN00_02820, partial [Aliifodinibius sp.]|nr:hypothetical protein [Fodinibius sp.]NIV12114.1 hypothetical protein [Fodinibius sp.]NIY23787.1 hypothetical protein [Fodinibius sp.]